MSPESDAGILVLSLRTAAAATLAALVVAVPLAWWAARASFRGKSLLDALLMSPLVLPPTVVGFALLWLVGANGPVGRFLDGALGLRLVFTWWAAVLAAAVVAFPLIYLTAKAAFFAVEEEYLAVARTLGAGPWRRFRQVGLGAAWPGLVAAAVLGFARALGEFGATLMVAGNIPGETRTLPLAIYTDVETGDWGRAGGWAVAALVGTLAVTWLSEKLGRLAPPRKRRRLPARVAARPAFVPGVDGHRGLRFDVTKRLGPFRLEATYCLESRRCALVGASGAGKSLLLRCLSGVARPDGGEIVAGETTWFSSENGTWVSPERRGTGHVFQSYALFPHLTVFENVAFGLATLAPEGRAGRAWEMLEAFELEALASRLPRELSGGQQQRVALARALAPGPGLLLLDEPLAAVDAHLRHRLEQRLLDLSRRFSGTTVVVTHNLEEAFRLADELVLLDGGRVLACGEKHRVFRNPGSVRSAELTGCKNIVRAQPGTHPSRLRLPDWNCELALAGPAGGEVRALGIRAHAVELGSGAGPSDSNTFPCWLADWSETPHRFSLKLKLGSPAAAPSDFHVQAELVRPAWERLRDRPQPWWVRLPPDQVMPLTEGAP